MTKPKLEFPKGFLWGAATSSHQVEGNNRNDWTEWEKQNADRLAQEARSYWQDWQREKFPEMLKPENYISGRAADHYNRFKEDFKLAKNLGHNATRFSLEWSRIEPKEGEFNQRELDHYKEVVETLRGLGIEPFVTLWHWTNPIWIRDIGGWENKKTINYFLRYIEFVTQTLGSSVNFWIPLNEPQSYIGMSYVAGLYPPRVKSLGRASRVMKNMITAHKEAYRVIHQKLGDSVQVGTSQYLVYHTPSKNNFLNLLTVKILDYVRGQRFVRKMNASQDFIGLQYYHHDRIKIKIGGRFLIAEAENENKEISDMGWEIYPEGIYHLLKTLKKYNKPIYIMENGIADSKDAKREKFIKDHLSWVHKAISEGVDIRGYFHWSLMDNFEWDKGFWPRFGLIGIDYQTLERKPRPSAHIYQDICEGNSL